MATGNVNIKINQTIKGNKFSGKARVSQKGRLHFTLPGNVIINIKTRRKNNTRPDKQTNKTPQQQNKTQQKPERMKSND